MPRTCTTYIFLETENRDGQDQKEIDGEAVGFSLLLQCAHGQGGEERVSSLLIRGRSGFNFCFILTKIVVGFVYIL